MVDIYGFHHDKKSGWFFWATHVCHGDLFSVIDVYIPRSQDPPFSFIIRATKITRRFSRDRLYSIIYTVYTVINYTFISIKFFSDSFASSCQFQLKLFHMRWFFICDMTFSMTNRRILLTKLCILNKLVDLFFHVFTPKCVDLSFYCRINIKVITIDIEIFKWNSALPPLSIKILKIINFVLDLLNLKVLVK